MIFHWLCGSFCSPPIPSHSSVQMLKSNQCQVFVCLSEIIAPLAHDETCCICRCQYSNCCWLDLYSSHLVFLSTSGLRSASVRTRAGALHWMQTPKGGAKNHLNCSKPKPEQHEIVRVTFGLMEMVDKSLSGVGSVCHGVLTS